MQLHSLNLRHEPSLRALRGISFAPLFSRRILQRRPPRLALGEPRARRLDPRLHVLSIAYRCFDHRLKPSEALAAGATPARDSLEAADRLACQPNAGIAGGRSRGQMKFEAFGFGNKVAGGLELFRTLLAVGQNPSQPKPREREPRRVGRLSRSKAAQAGIGSNPAPTGALEGATRWCSTLRLSHASRHSLAASLPESLYFA
jgi:hypothetical protein